jgi:hypothetical protein
MGAPPRAGSASPRTRGVHGSVCLRSRSVLAQEGLRAFSAEGRGEYALEEVPPTAEGIDGIDLKPEEIAHVLSSSKTTDAAVSLSSPAGL